MSSFPNKSAKWRQQKHYMKNYSAEDKTFVAKKHMENEENKFFRIY